MTVTTPFGPIFPTEGPCKDPPNLVHFQNRAGQVLTLQKPAADAYHAANRRLRRRLGRKRVTILVTGSERTCSYQTSLYRSDPQRFANPDESRHCRGLAIDVNTNVLTRAMVKALTANHWHRPRSDEPWHFSYWETG